MYTVFSVSIVADICIAGSLAFLLMESRTGIPRTDSILKVLTLYFINTGAIIVCCDLACIICVCAIVFFLSVIDLPIFCSLQPCRGTTFFLEFSSSLRSVSRHYWKWHGESPKAHFTQPTVYFWSLLAALDNQDSFRSRKPTPAFNYPLSDLERRPNQSASDIKVRTGWKF